MNPTKLANPDNGTPEPENSPAWALEAAKQLPIPPVEIFYCARIIAAAAPKDEWMPIESAPKDGTEILLVAVTPFGSDQGLCYWRDDMKGWIWGLGNAFNGATHWRPLPPAPAAMKGDE